MTRTGNCTPLYEPEACARAMVQVARGSLPIVAPRQHQSTARHRAPNQKVQPRTRKVAPAAQTDGAGGPFRARCGPMAGNSAWWRIFAPSGPLVPAGYLQRWQIRWRLSPCFPTARFVVLRQYFSAHGEWRLHCDVASSLAVIRLLCIANCQSFSMFQIFSPFCKF